MKKKREVYICRSETWMGDNFNDISSVLEDAIKDFIGVNDKIINIESKEQGGLNRFWIYCETENEVPQPKQER